jgi:hypothetical protein
MTVQNLSINYPVFILTIVALLGFGVIYAYAVRQMDKHGVQGQTAYLVVVGVGVTVIAASAVIGFLNSLQLIACFAASGAPMVIEYIQRTHRLQKRDEHDAKEIARELLK